VTNDVEYGILRRV